MNNSDYEYKFMCYVIDRVIPFPVILERAGYEGYDYQGNVYCPFHDNTDTPAAKLFKDDDGDKIYCFGECRRLYNPSDVITKGLLKIKLTKVFNNVWKQLSEQKKANLREEYGKPKDYLTEGFKRKVKEMEKFKRGEIDYKRYLELVLEAMELLKEEK